ncbi:PRC-barrel domain containing protein [uncultured Alteromonas sp.]|jgi:sporulation protein YlmC with PRC-barrel domain|uniref:PRC-barrel domain containing protein n=1 Tax=uncultured Alteromonas sp. TaxID=179113 RepID=UPI0025EB44B7|nr:PRC-barrel domain containing protein [uncultured Alteromonas sp.]
METRFSQLSHYSIHATDGDIGACQDLLIDDEQWIVRYIVADTNTWLPLSRKVVITPISIDNLQADEETMAVSLTREALKNSPSLEEHQPVSREYESLFYQYFGYGYYWTGPGAWGEYAHPLELVNSDIEDHIAERKDNSHLRSCDELTGYTIALSDAQTGHVEDFIIQLPQWSVSHLIINLNDWLPGGKRVKIDSRHIRHIDWAGHVIELDISKKELEGAVSAD